MDNKTKQIILLIIFLILFLIILKPANAGTNKDIYTQIDYKVDCIYKQYKKNKSYLNNLIITDFCVKRNFAATQITIIQKNGDALKDIANEVLGDPTKFLKELNELLEICDKKLKIIRNNAVEDIIISFSIKHKMTVDQIKKAIRVKGIII